MEKFKITFEAFNPDTDEVYGSVEYEDCVPSMDKLAEDLNNVLVDPEED